MLSEQIQSLPKQWAIAKKNYIQTYRPVYSFCWPFQFMGALLHFRSLRRLKTWFPKSMANARLNGLALPYIHKPTEIDSSSVLWDASGHRRIALPVSSIRRTINLISWLFLIETKLCSYATWTSQLSVQILFTFEDKCIFCWPVSPILRPVLSVADLYTMKQSF